MSMNKKTETNNGWGSCSSEWFKTNHAILNYLNVVFIMVTDWLLLETVMVIFTVCEHGDAHSNRT